MAAAQLPFERSSGRDRLSTWFVFGYTFSEVARYIVEVDQQGMLWRTNTTISSGFKMLPTNCSDAATVPGEMLREPKEFDAGDSGLSPVAVGISVSGPLDDEVRQYLAEEQTEVSALLLLAPTAHSSGIVCRVPAMLRLWQMA